jgi:hypothetical protein
LADWLITASPSTPRRAAGIPQAAANRTGKRNNYQDRREYGTAPTKRKESHVDTLRIVGAPRSGR